jgi:hypothetical protein
MKLLRQLEYDSGRGFLPLAGLSKVRPQEAFRWSGTRCRPKQGARSETFFELADNAGEANCRCRTVPQNFPCIILSVVSR